MLAVALRRAPRRVRRGFTLAAGVYLTGALVLETLSGIVLQAAGDRTAYLVVIAATGEHVVYESRLELDRLWLANFDARVERIAAQALWLVGRDGSALRRHMPDLLLRDRTGMVTLVDVRPPWLLNRAQVSDVFSWTGPGVCREGRRYKVWCGGDLVVLNNIRLLGSARRRQFLDDAEPTRSPWPPARDACSARSLSSRLCRSSSLIHVARRRLWCPGRGRC